MYGDRHVPAVVGGTCGVVQPAVCLVVASVLLDASTESLRCSGGAVGISTAVAEIGAVGRAGSASAFCF